jgi:hypothetical protein
MPTRASPLAETFESTRNDPRSEPVSNSALCVVSRSIFFFCRSSEAPSRSCRPERLDTARLAIHPDMVESPENIVRPAFRAAAAPCAALGTAAKFFTRYAFRSEFGFTKALSTNVYTRGMFVN